MGGGGNKQFVSQTFKYQNANGEILAKLRARIIRAHRRNAARELNAKKARS